MEHEERPSSDLTQEMSGGTPSREELQSELLDIPDWPEAEPSIPSPTLDKILGGALRHVRGRRGGDLLAVILVGSGVRRALTPHSDLDLIVLVKGQDEGQEVVRVGERIIDIRYRGYKAVEQELAHAPRLPPLLRKARVLFEHEAFGTRLIERANQRFRQGPAPADLNERIRLKVDCLHWLGKAEDLLQPQLPTAQLCLNLFLEGLLQAFFRLRGYWLTAPADLLRFVASRDGAVGQLIDRFLLATPPERLALGRQLVEVVFKDVPHPPRVD